MLGDYNKASVLLREAANLKSVIIALDGEYSNELVGAAQSQGLIVWNDSKMTIYGYNANVSTTTISRIVDNAGSRLDLSFSADSISLLREALSDIYSNAYTVRPINETTTTYLNGV